MSREISFNAFVQTIQGNRAGDRSEKFRVSATYMGGGVAGSISFDVPIAQAQQFFVGQTITVAVRTEDTES